MTMIRPLNKRAPLIESDELQAKYAKISKADWADLYFDLFRAANGESASDQEVMQDVEQRLALLKSCRKAWR